jgi:hypothetical protein
VETPAQRAPQLHRCPPSAAEGLPGVLQPHPGEGPQVYEAIRQTLVKHYGLPVPVSGVPGDDGLCEHRAGFAAFLAFLKDNLSGQSAIRADAWWCSQAQAIQGFSGFALPDMILREDEICRTLPNVVARMGLVAPSFPGGSSSDGPYDLAAIYDDEIKKLAAAAYRRDYVAFGFDRWGAQRQAACSDSAEVRIV